MLKFIVEQVAICPRDPEAAMDLLKEMGAVEWALDHVVANGEVYGDEARNEADLAFNYEMSNPAKALEFEVLKYTDGNNWMTGRVPAVSHLGMHCSEADLEKWKVFFDERNIPIAQEVYTESHTNPVIDGKRLYHYVIFHTFAILGVDLKFIVRRIIG